MSRPGSPPSGTSRTLDIPLDAAETISIDLDDLVDDPKDYVDLMKEGNAAAHFWTRLAGEYWRRRNHNAAHTICNAAIEHLVRTRRESTLSPVYAMLANMRVNDAQRAPKMRFLEARRDVLTSDVKTKSAFVDEGNALFNKVVKQSLDEELYAMSRGILLLSSRKMDEARSAFEHILSKKPNNIIALMGRARIMFQKREYGPALRGFQRVLQLAPDSLPDPRIGIGLCLWAVGAKEKACMAWTRSLEVHPNHVSAMVLLGLAKLNASKDVGLHSEKRGQEYAAGIRLIEQAFKADKTSAASANALAEMFLRKGDLSTALKLAERTIQYADTLSLLADGHLRAGRAVHLEGDRADEATRHYEISSKSLPSVWASVGLAGAYIQKNDPAAAIHVLESVLAPGGPAGGAKDGPAAPKIEAMLMLGSLQAHARPLVSSADLAKGRARARELFDQALRELENAKSEMTKRAGIISGEGMRVRNLGEEVALHVEIARLWSEDPAVAGLTALSADKSSRALSEALRVAQAAGATKDAIYARLLNNVGALKHGEGNFDAAKEAYEEAMSIALSLDPEVGEALQVTILYNMGRASEDNGDTVAAEEVFQKLLSRHPEYVDAKVRRAHLLVTQHRTHEAHELVKQAVASTPHALNIRAYYTHFLVRVNYWRPAKEFVFSTMRDCDKNDVYALCAAGVIHYNQARESGRGFGPGSEMPPEERKKNFIRSAEFFDKALDIDPCCAVAAQGLAIIIAEDALGNLGGALGGGSSNSAEMMKAAHEALDVFSKIRESVSDGSVYTNMGHCYYVRDEYERAIEAYETANKRFYEGRNVNVLLYIARTWYAKANKDQSYSAMRSALKYAQQAALYNIAMIQQKAGEMMFGLEASRREMAELRRAIDMAERAQLLFSALAADISSGLPYNKELADQRRLYGDGLLRRKDEHIAKQEAHERDLDARKAAAKQRRDDEKERIETAERERLEHLKRQAEQLAEERKRARLELEELTARMQDESDEERRQKELKKAKRSQAKASQPNSGDEVDDAIVEGAKKRKRRVVRKKRGDSRDAEPEAVGTDEDAEALFSEPDEKPTKRISRKRVVKEEEDGDEDEPTEAPRRKKIKSQETIEDSDEHMDDL
ncbi:hypothetical protein BKA62DRAFT_706704 [Auriculariales sp. MPI-PUGE-AT-0066]|nr:hypothetical protein BKA62DRAFT_706704 [Auriculariales sp. MPI-PUGE-AT-0066]